MPLRDGKDALAVQWLEVTIANSAGKTTYRNAFVTSLGITADNVAELAACARARWKIENESFNVLKNNGYNLAHNFGHGKQHLAATFAALNLLAFAFHTVLDYLETLWQQARQAIGTRKAFFADAGYCLFPNWLALSLATASGKLRPLSIAAGTMPVRSRCLGH